MQQGLLVPLSCNMRRNSTSTQTYCLHLSYPVIVKASSGPRYVVGCRSKVDKEKLVAGTRVVLDMTTLTIMRALPREVRTSLCCSFDYYIFSAHGA